MKALITAGGRGTRLRPITNTMNKHLVPICNKPLLYQAIENVVAIGIREVVININADDHELPAIVGDGSQWDIAITYIRQEQPLGLGHVLKLAEPHLKGEPFVFYYGDNVLAGGLRPHLDKFLAAGANCHLCVVKVDDPSHFGVAVVDGELVSRTVEKPQAFVSDLAITGVQFYDDSIFEAIKHVKPTPPKPPRTIAEMDIPPANQWLIDNGYKVTYSEITGWWKDTGRPKDLIAASKLLLDHLVPKQEGFVDAASVIEGNVAIEAGARVVGSHLIGPVIIGAGAVIEHSTVGPFVSIGAQTRIRETEISESMVLNNTVIEHIDRPISQSIIGRSVHLKKNGERPDHHLIIGDQSDISFS
jgi:glucose-1-phosphate thymidylyltransferase